MGARRRPDPGAERGPVGSGPGGDDVVGRVADNTYALSRFDRPTADLRRTLPSLRARPAGRRRRFRLIFVAVYAALVAVSVIGLRAVGDGPGEALRDDMVKSACAARGPGRPGAGGAVPPGPPAGDADRHDRRAARPPRTTRAWPNAFGGCWSRRPSTAGPSSKSAKSPRGWANPEHRVSQCISTALGFPNFNRWINHHRIARAKRLLADPDERRSILEIAFACGFLPRPVQPRLPRRGRHRPSRAFIARRRGQARGLARPPVLLPTNPSTPRPPRPGPPRSRGRSGARRRARALSEGRG